MIDTNKVNEAGQQINAIVADATKRSGEAGAELGAWMSAVTKQASLAGEQVGRALRQASVDNRD